MAIVKKPSVHKVDISLTNAIINKGGGSPSNQLSSNKNLKITLRLPVKMLDIIDNYLEKSINNKTRTSWMKEAIEEKIRKDILQ